MFLRFPGAGRVLIVLALLVGSLPPLTAETVALAPFLHVDSDRNDPAVGDANLDLILVRLASLTPYSFVERSAIDRIISEQALSSEGFATADSAARLGRLLRVDVILTGTYFSPPGKSPYVLLEAVEADRAEVIARAEVPLTSVGQQHLFAPLAADDIEGISRAAGPLLAEAFVVIKARPQHVLLKFLALPNLIRNPVYKRVGERLEAELARRATTTPIQRLLRTDRPEAATDESELRLLGLVESDASTWEQFADHYVWGVCEEEDGLPLLRLSVWDGRAMRRELIIPLPENPNSLDVAIGAACDSILEATTRAMRLTPAETFADEQRAAVADLLMKFAERLSQPGESSFNFRAAKRLLVAAIFLHPARLDAWVQLDRHRSRNWRGDPIHSIASQVAYRLRVRTRFIVDANGTIQSDALFAEQASDFGCLKSLYAQLSGKGVAFPGQFDRLALQKLWDRTVADTLVESARAASQLMHAAPGQDDAFRNAAESILADVFQPQLPRWFHQPDLARVERIVDVLTPRLKPVLALSYARNFGSRGPKQWRFEPRERITEVLCRRGRLADAEHWSILDPSELSQAMAALAAEPDLHEVHRLRAEYYLKACSTEPADPRVAISDLLARVVPESAEAPRMPFRLEPWTMRQAVKATDLPTLERILELGTPARGEGVALVTALNQHNWIAVEYLLQRGLDVRAASWPINKGGDWGQTGDYERRSDTIAAFALTEAVAQNRLDIADRLIAQGVRFRPDSGLGNEAIERALRRRSADGLKRLLAAGALTKLPAGTGGGGRPSPCLAAAVEVRDLALLQMLLAAGANVNDTLIDDAEYNSAPEGVFTEMKKRLRNAVYFAGWAGWREGLDAMLAAPTYSSFAVYDPRRDVEDWPHQLAADPMISGQLLRASLRAMLPQPTPAQTAGIELFSAIAADDAPRVADAWRNLAARDFRLADQSPLGFALLHGRPKLARWLILSGAPVDTADACGRTALLYAAGRGDTELVQLIASKGANLSPVSRSSSTPLVYAIRAGKESTALALISLGASVRPATAAADDPLFEAVKYNMVAAVDQLIRRGADPRAVYEGCNILFAAARSDNPALIQRFVKLGCNPAQRSRTGETPLAIAVSAGAAQSTAQLLALGVTDPAAVKRAISAIDRGERLPYSADVSSRPRHYRPDIAACAALMNKFGQLPAAVNRSESRAEFGAWTTRFLADLDEKSPAEIAGFVSRGGSLDAYVGDVARQNELPLQDATSRGDLEQVKLLLALDVPAEERPGAKRSQHDRGIVDPTTPLVRAAHHREPLKHELIKLLIAHGARADAAATGNYPVVLAVALGHPAAELGNNAAPETVRLLLDHGAVVDAHVIAAYASIIQRFPSRAQKIEAALTPEQIRRMRATMRASPRAD